MDFELSERPITIGRSQDADMILLDEKVSRIHCGIRLWDGDFYIKDLKSRNGTFVNNQRIDVAKLKVGDRIKVGSTVFSFEQESMGASDALQAMEEEMAQGKGYSTILREIVNTMDEPGAASTSPGALSGSTDTDTGESLRVKTRKKKSE